MLLVHEVKESVRTVNKIKPLALSLVVLLSESDTVPPIIETERRRMKIVNIRVRFAVNDAVDHRHFYYKYEPFFLAMNPLLIYHVDQILVILEAPVVVARRKEMMRDRHYCHLKATILQYSTCRTVSIGL